MKHYTKEELELFRNGKMSLLSRISCSGHLKNCPDCAGLMEEHIDMAHVCTGCHPELYWSHRKMGEARGVQGAMISL